MEGRSGGGDILGQLEKPLKDGFRFFQKRELEGLVSDLIAGSLKRGWGLSGRQERATSGIGAGDFLLLWKLVLSPLASQVVIVMSLRAQPPSAASPVLGLNLVMEGKVPLPPAPRGG